MIKIHPFDLRPGMTVDTFDGPARVVAVTWYAGSTITGMKSMRAELSNGHGIYRPRSRRPEWIEVLTA